jgi:hypothetical protein
MCEYEFDDFWKNNRSILSDPACVYDNANVYDDAEDFRLYPPQEEPMISACLAYGRRVNENML